MQANEESKVSPAQAATREEEKKGEEAKAGPKHQRLQNDAGESAELMENRHTRNVSSIFIN